MFYNNPEKSQLKHDSNMIIIGRSKDCMKVS